MTGRDGIAEVPAPSGTVTFLFSDIEGSTQRWDRHRGAMQEALRLHDRIMRSAIAAREGRVFKTMGDAFFAAFETPESAAAAALDAQRALVAADFSAVDGLSVRIAINTGTVDERDDDYFGPAVNRVARLLALGHGGQVLLSGIAADLVRENPPPQATLTDLGVHALKDLERPEHVYQLVAPGLRRDFPPLRAALHGPWLVPDAMRTRYFTGREDVLARLRQQMLERRRAALSGLGGIGKTQTAIEYGVRHHAAYPRGVFWINAETVNGLNSGFVEIANALHLAAAESNDHEQIVKAVLEWLNGTDGWLLILDNVDERREIQPFMPEGGDVLITSRESVFQELGVPRALEVGDLNGNEALEFLLTRTGREDSEPGERAATTQLAAELGNLPLALEQAAAYITETNAAFSDYLTAFRKRRVSLLEKSSGLVSHETVAVTWAANFAAVEALSLASADALRVSAFLASDAIPFEFFSAGAQALGGPIAEAVSDSDDLSVRELLRPLARYSLIRSDPKSRVYSVHRLVQEIVRAAIGDTERAAYVKRAVAGLNAAFPEVEYATWAQCDRLVPHVMSIVAWIDSFDTSDGAVRVLQATVDYLDERGHYAEAQTPSEHALAIRERALGPDHQDVARSLNNLANVYWYRGRNAEARPLFARALATLERTVGADHADVAVSLNGLARIDGNAGRYAEAQQVFERALAIRERALGPDHPDVARVLNNLAIVQVDQGRYAEAQPLHERALAIWERALGPDHPDVGFSLNNLANVFLRRGLYAEAESLCRRSLAIRERALGPDHPQVSFTLTNLAHVYLKQGRHAEAEPLFERALAIKERVLEPDHPYLVETLVGFASLRKDQGRNAEAIALFERALAVKERTFAANHPELAEIRNTIDALRSAM